MNVGAACASAAQTQSAHHRERLPERAATNKPCKINFLCHSASSCFWGHINDEFIYTKRHDRLRCWRFYDWLLTINQIVRMMMLIGSILSHRLCHSCVTRCMVVFSRRWE
jgi:hypothetical protein